MKDTKIEKYVLTHQEDRNINDTVFGGYLMKEAIELADIASSIFTTTKEFPTIKHINEI